MGRAEEYRLRAFEAAYIHPHLEFLDEYVRPGWSWTDMRLLEPESSEASLRAFLLLEAAEWIELGRSAGYFPKYLEPIFPAPKHSDISDLKLPALVAIAAGTLNFPLIRNSWRPHRHGPPFDEVLASAMSDLTSARLEFLRLYLFTDDAQWLAKVGELQVFENLLFRSLDLGPFPDETIDRLSWALQGPETTLLRTGLPSDWRASSIMERTDLLDRAITLSQIREDIRVRVESTVDEEIEDEFRQDTADGFYLPEDMRRDGDDPPSSPW